MGVENGKKKSHDEENSREPAGEFHKDVGRLRTKNVFRHAAAERRAETFALRPLHQDDKSHEQGHKDVDAEQDADQDVHDERGISAD